MRVAPLLPSEIISCIFSHLPVSPESTFQSAALVSRAWYSAAIIYLYRSPIVTGRNFDLFVRAVCPSINAHVRYNGLAGFIRRLDLSNLVHNGSKSLTARLLGRVKNNLEEFVAPQASFGVNSLAALSKCSHLRCLDLGFVSEGIPMPDLLRSIQNLDRLVNLHLPRAASHATSKHRGSELCLRWPKNLREIHFNGNFLENNSLYLNAIPPSTSALYFGNCPSFDYQLLASLVKKKGSQLQILRLGLTTRLLSPNLFFPIGQMCVHIQHLSITIEMLSFIWREAITYRDPVHPSFPGVKVLEIDCLEEHDDVTLDSCLRGLSDLCFEFDTVLLNLRKLLIHRRLKWTEGKSRSKSIGEIDGLLKALAREDGETASMSEDEAGVALFGIR